MEIVTRDRVRAGEVRSGTNTPQCGVGIGVIITNRRAGRAHAAIAIRGKIKSIRSRAAAGPLGVIAGGADARREEFRGTAASVREGAVHVYPTIEMQSVIAAETLVLWRNRQCCDCG